MQIDDDNIDWYELLAPLEELRNCNYCPRKCNADRFSDTLGWCKSDASFAISSICAHKGEEPVISGRNGICNVFFAHCNLQCNYCQNYQISNNSIPIANFKYEIKSALKEIISLLDSDCMALGFVSSSHFIPQIKVIVNALHTLGKYPIIVMNTNCYDNVETIREFEGIVDVYLPDFKYIDSVIAGKYSQAINYPTVAMAALKEMFRQKGTMLYINDDGQASSGVIVRHLILPGHINNSLAVLNALADELSPSIHLSLMSQYYPTGRIDKKSLFNRRINQSEYNIVVADAERLGFYRGWLQDLQSSENYKPDFMLSHPFEK